MPKTKKLTKPPARDRVVYEVTGPSGTRSVEAGTTAELRDRLAPILPGVEPYAVQAVARLASVERATVTTATWSVRRVGVMTFQADGPAAAQRAPQRSQGDRPGPSAPANHEERPAAPQETSREVQDTLDSLFPTSPEARV